MKKKYKIAYPYTLRKRPERLGPVPSPCPECKVIPCECEEEE